MENHDLKASDLLNYPKLVSSVTCKDFESNQSGEETFYARMMLDMIGKGKVRGMENNVENAFSKAWNSKKGINENDAENGYIDARTINVNTTKENFPGDKSKYHIDTYKETESDAPISINESTQDSSNEERNPAEWSSLKRPSVLSPLPDDQTLKQLDKVTSVLKDTDLTTKPKAKHAKAKPKRFISRKKRQEEIDEANRKERDTLLRHLSIQRKHIQDKVDIFMSSSTWWDTPL